MDNRLGFHATAVVAGLVFAACVKVPVTGRLQMNLVPAATMASLGKQSYKETLAKAKQVEAGPDVDVLRRVGKRIARASGEDLDWSYALLDDPTINAWCLPGGYIGVYNGILPAFQSEAGMAFVLGHEVGHATARHGAERMSTQLALVGGLAVLDAFLSGGTAMSNQERGAVMGAIGLGAEVGLILPFSRKHESEADIIGVMYMAKAGYPPGEAIALWDRMEKLGGKGGPAFLSTHPANDRRQDVIREWLPQARKRYERNKLKEDTKVRLWGKG